MLSTIRRKEDESMSCHGCAHEDADLCSERDVHLPSFKQPCQNCIRNQYRASQGPIHGASLLLPAIPTDNYIEACDLAEMISKEVAFRIVNNQLRLGNRTVGWIFNLADGRKALRTTRDRAKHYMRIMKGWGIATAVLRFLKETNFDGIQIQVGRNEYLNSDIQDWFEHGVERQFPGFEKQTFLSEKYMTKNRQRVWDLPK